MEKSTIKYWLDKSVDYAIGAFAGGGTLKMGTEFLSINAFYVWLISLIVAMGVWHWSTIIRKTKNRKPVQLEELVGKKFKHQTVRIDGKKFISCEFFGCTLEYAGGDFNFDKSDVAENCGFTFLTRETAAAAQLILNFTTIMHHDPNKRLGKFDEHGRLMDEPKITKINEPQAGVKN
jgi:hypothetical protein